LSLLVRLSPCFQQDSSCTNPDDDSSPPIFCSGFTSELELHFLCNVFAAETAPTYSITCFFCMSIQIPELVGQLTQIQALRRNSSKVPAELPLPTRPPRLGARPQHGPRRPWPHLQTEFISISESLKALQDSRELSMRVEATYSHEPPYLVCVALPYTVSVGTLC
jgi:hypothetical protein